MAAAGCGTFITPSDPNSACGSRGGVPKGRVHGDVVADTTTSAPAGLVGVPPGPGLGPGHLDATGAAPPRHLSLRDTPSSEAHGSHGKHPR